ATRWKVTRDGTAGSFIDYRIALGDTPITASNFVVQAPTDQGTYDNVLGTSTFTAATATTVNTVAMASAQLAETFTGNFAYANAANCTTVNPGNTIADTTITQIVTTQNSSATGIVSGSANVTLQTANTGIVTGLTVTGAGIPAGTTVTAISGTALTLSQSATASSASQTLLTFSIVQTPTTLCNSQMVALRLENVVSGSGITYQWQSSSDDVTYTDISGAIAATYVATPTGDTFYRCMVTCPFGPSTATSTPVEITFTNQAPTVTPVTICDPGVATLEATASSGTINWYETATGGVAVATGATYVPTLTETTTYYVAAENTSSYTAGRVFAGTGTQTAPFSGLVFNTSTNIRLNSVKVHPKQTTGAADAGAPITIKLYKDGVQVPGTTAVTFTPATNVGTVSASISNTVVLNYDIPAGTGYKLLATNGLSSTNVLGRLSSFPATTPTVTGAISFTGSANSFDGTPDASYNNFFEWDVTEYCSSARVAVTATVGCTPVQDCATIGTATTTAVTCFEGTDGTATITMSDETPSEPAISYTVNGGTSQNATLVAGEFTITGLTVGTHSVVVSNVGCPDVTVSITVAGPTSALTNTTTEAVCGSYTWSVTGLSYTDSGTYTGTTTNGDGCTVNETLELTVTPNTSNTTVVSACDTYTWAENNETYTTSGTYTSVVDCHTETLELTINSAATPTGSATQTISVDTANEATLEDLVVNPTTVIWYASIDDAQNETNPLAITTVLTDGETYYAVNVSSGCSSAPFAVTVTVALGTNGFDTANFKYYPNPTSGIITLSYSDEITAVSVINMLGQIVLESKTNGNQVQVDLSSLPSSAYFVKVESNTTSTVVKVIKRN
ncbi:MAG TPA: T9SS type A sorting domain-containing protein, partial [Flavobacterium sp.]|nr:T9SS type A sorting domain-containing protein [Flavobacterium sp.]